MRRLFFGPALVLLLSVTLVGGCGAGSSELDEAYARGYADGVASAEREGDTVAEAYEQGYADGLSAAAGVASEEVCQRCYGLGYAEGYQAALAANAGATKTEAAQND